MTDAYMRLDGKAAIVTGSATGIGAAVALKLAARGASVVINYTRSRTEAEETQAAVQKIGAQSILVQADVSNDADCRRMAKAAEDACKVAQKAVSADDKAGTVTLQAPPVTVATHPVRSTANLPGNGFSPTLSRRTTIGMC